MGRNTILMVMAAVMTFTLTFTAGAADEPVEIAFDSASKRIDLLTGETLPDYTRAQRGSIQFFLERLDTPERLFHYYHDGIQQATIESLASMTKLQPQYAIWRLRYKSGSKNTPRIHHQAVSFIPLDPATGAPGERVFVMLNDLALINWGEQAE